MKITTKLVLSFLIVSIVPLIVIGYMGLQALDRVGAVAVNESTEALKRLGEDSIQQQSVAVARQVALYLEAHPELRPLSEEVLRTDSALADIAIQPVGKTGYTALYNSDAIMIFHPDAAMVGEDMQARLSTTLPASWAILAASLGGTPAADYYEWQEPDGQIRDKYMSCVPVGDTSLRVAATTYIDEFYRPIWQTEARITGIAQEIRRYFLAAIIVAGIVATGVGLWLAWGISRPILAITNAATAVEQEKFEPTTLDAMARRDDELGRLAHVFQRMAREVYARAQRLKQQVQNLSIEINQIKRKEEVAKIVDTDFFQDLQGKAHDMRRKRSRREDGGKEETG